MSDCLPRARCLRILEGLDSCQASIHDPAPVVPTTAWNRGCQDFSRGAILDSTLDFLARSSQYRASNQRFSLHLAWLCQI